MTFLLRLLLFVIFPITAFVGGYRITDFVFREKMIAYPFEFFGVAVGFGFFFWTLALACFFNDQLKK